MSPHAAAPASPPKEHVPKPNEILQALRGSIEPVKVGPLYRAGMLVLAFAMVLLPLAYVAIVGLVGWSLWYHATENVTILSGRGGVRYRLLAYVAPLAVGAVGLFFLVKPLFAPRGRAAPSVALERDEEPLLFAFVERLARIVGAPVPARIELDLQVNASASLAPTLAGLLSDELTLTIGLPLAGGLSLRQFAGVLAHEFGHFRQGTAMRVEGVVRLVSNWFRRVLYERDAWDERLESAAKTYDHWALQVVLQLARTFVWLSRRVLWALMWIGQVLSAFLSRQMEYDADRYQSRVAGSATIERTLRDLGLLTIADRQGTELLERAWAERRICEDLPGLTLALFRMLPAELGPRIAASLRDQKTGLFDTHPADGERIASAMRDGSPGIFTLEAPASGLFADFDRSCREITRRRLHEAMGEELSRFQRVGAKDLLADLERAREESDAFERYFQGLVLGGRRLPFSPGPGAAPSDPVATLESLRTAREELRALGVKLEGASNRFEELHETRKRVARARAVADSGGKIQLAAFELPESPEGLDGVDARSAREFARCEEALRAADPILRARLDAAMAMLHHPPVEARFDEARPLREEGGRLLRLLAELEARIDRAQWREAHTALSTLLAAYDRGDHSEGLIRAAEAHAASVHRHLTRLRALTDLPYPFQHPGPPASVADFVVPTLPEAEAVGDLAAAAALAADNLAQLYWRALCRLAQIAEKAEGFVGLGPLPAVEAKPR